MNKTNKSPVLSSPALAKPDPKPRAGYVRTSISFNRRVLRKFEAAARASRPRSNVSRLCNLHLAKALGVSL